MKRVEKKRLRYGNSLELERTSSRRLVFAILVMIIIVFILVSNFKSNSFQLEKLKSYYSIWAVLHDRREILSNSKNQRIHEGVHFHGKQNKNRYLRVFAGTDKNDRRLLTSKSILSQMSIQLYILMYSFMSSMSEFILNFWTSSTKSSNTIDSTDRTSSTGQTNQISKLNRLVNNRRKLQFYGPTTFPSKAPSTLPSAFHTSSPTLEPSRFPVSLPSTRPSLVTSNVPSPVPTDAPSHLPTFVPSHLPTLLPSSHPSDTLSYLPSLYPSDSPSYLPSLYPSDSPTNLPSSSPSISGIPSSLPSLLPSLAPSNSPSLLPSRLPSFYPSKSPSLMPSLSPFPSFAESKRQVTTFKQNFHRESKSIFLSDDEELMFAESICALPPNYIENVHLTTSRCTITETRVSDLQRLVRLRKLKANDKQRNLALLESKLTLSYSIEFDSLHLDPSSFSIHHRDYMRDEENRQDFMEILNERGLGITFVGQVSIVLEDDSTPSMAPVSSVSSLAPTTSTSSRPSTLKLATPALTTTKTGEQEDFEIEFVVAVALAIAAAGISFVAVVLCFCMRKEKNLQNQKISAQNSESSTDVKTDIELQLETIENAHGKGLSEEIKLRSSKSNDRGEVLRIKVVNIRGPNLEPMTHLPTHESVVSIPSLLSPVVSYTDDMDAVDDFDSFKDIHLEKLRSEVQKMVAGMEDMMSQALTNALTFDEGDEDSSFFGDNGWDSYGTGSDIEVEANILYDTYEFVKRNEESDLGDDDRRRDFLRNILNSMVSRVRYEMIAPEPAAMIIHGAASMLGFELAAVVPNPALMVTGLRKMTRTEDLRDAFSNFGEIDSVVALNSKGFGLIRFKTRESIAKALTRFRLDEIVVHDVAVRLNLVGQGFTRKSRDHERHRRASSHASLSPTHYKTGNMRHINVFPSQLQLENADDLSMMSLSRSEMNNQYRPVVNHKGHSRTRSEPMYDIESANYTEI